jgi:hypothetical protein
LANARKGGRIALRRNIERMLPLRAAQQPPQAACKKPPLRAAIRTRGNAIEK